MDREELIKKLENLDVPELVVPAHRERLKYVLLTTPPVRSFADAPNMWDKLCSKMRTWIGSLRQPAWKMTIAGMVAIFVVGAIFGIVTFLTAPSPAVVAADIVRKDANIQHSLSGNGEIIIIKVDVKNTTANVVCGRGMGDFIEAEVDLNGRAVVSTRRYEGLLVPELAQDIQADAINVAMSDPRVKDIVSKGAKIGRVFPSFSSISTVTIINGDLIKVTPDASLAIVPFDLNGKVWLVQVSLADKKIERILEQQFRPLSESELRMILNL